MGTHMAESEPGELSTLMELIWGSLRDDLEQRLLAAGIPANVVSSIRLEPNSMGVLAMQSEPHLGLLWRKREAEALAMTRWLIGNSNSESETFRKIEGKLEDFINARDEASTLSEPDQDWTSALLSRAAFDDERASRATRELLVKAGELMAFGETLPTELATFVGERLQRLRQDDIPAGQALGIAEPVVDDRSLMACDAVMAASYYYLLKAAKPPNCSVTQWSSACAKAVSAAFDYAPSEVRKSAKAYRTLAKLSANDLRPLLKGAYVQLKKTARDCGIPLPPRQRPSSRSN